jgi:hypothetical protein
VNPLNTKRAAILNRLNRLYHVRRIIREGGFSARELADLLLSLESHFYKASGGPPRFTGNNRAFANGTIAYEVICRKCNRAFWVTALPFALCPDCDDSDFFRH